MMAVDKIPDGPLGDIIKRADELTDEIGAQIAGRVPPDKLGAHAVYAGMFLGLAMWAEDDAAMTVLRAWIIATDGGAYTQSAHYILTGERPARGAA